MEGGREVRGGGNVCIHITDSLCCIEEAKAAL